jgi:hypothetical protein
MLFSNCLFIRFKSILPFAAFVRDYFITYQLYPLPAFVCCYLPVLLFMPFQVSFTYWRLLKILVLFYTLCLYPASDSCPATPLLVLLNALNGFLSLPSPSGRGCPQGG